MKEVFDESFNFERDFFLAIVILGPTKRTEPHPKGMCAKLYRMRGLTLKNGHNTVIDLDLEFDGKRAFAIWDSVSVGNYELKARVEIDPARLKKITEDCCDFFYGGELVLPQPQNN